MKQDIRINELKNTVVGAIAHNLIDKNQLPSHVFAPQIAIQMMTIFFSPTLFYIGSISLYIMVLCTSNIIYKYLFTIF